MRKAPIAFAIIVTCGPYGTYHRIEKGETLWSISRKYGASIEEIIRINSITNPRRIKAGTFIFVPLEETGKKEEKIVERARKIEKRDRERKKRRESKITTKKNMAKPRVIEIPSRKAKTKLAYTHRTSPNISWPIKGRIISYFGKRGGRHHDGIDIKAPEGTAIKAAGDGVVIFSGFLKGYGNVVIIKHENVWYTVYAHNKYNVVKEGEFVRKGTVIAYVGKTGRATTAHLHFELRRRKKPVNPLLFLP